LEDEMLTYQTMDTPAGPLTAVVSDSGAVRASGFTEDVAELLALIHPALREEVRSARSLRGVQDAVALDEVAVEQRTGGEFTAHAWRVMREIKPGAPLTYSQFAELAGRPAAIRAAAAACARNPVALFVPCHRVLRLDGSLGGYRWGLPVKRWLLDHESAG
jgi:methylated-DNA-[protein]-cysteine S-methyltransferase